MRGSSRRAPARRRESSSRSSCASALAEVRIAISGLRRSWLTARRIAVLTASLRRSDSASKASAASRCLSIATPSSDASAGSRRLRAAAPPGLRVHEPDRPDASSVCQERMPVRSQRRVRPELDRRAFDLQRVRGLRGDTLELAGDVAALQQRARDLREERRLGRPTARACRELADHHRGDDEHAEREPVAGVLQRERVRRRQEVEVEGEHARDGDGDRQREAPEDRDGQHGEEVEHGQAQDRHVRLEQGDDGCERRDEPGACESAEQPPHRPASEVASGALERVPERDHAPMIAIAQRHMGICWHGGRGGGTPGP